MEPEIGGGRFDGGTSSSTDGVVASTIWDFLVSYAPTDLAWAEWIAWQLESAGYSVLIEAWDLVAGAHPAAHREAGIEGAIRTVAVVSRRYQQSAEQSAVYRAVAERDPDGKHRKLVPVRIEECEPGGFLGQIHPIDLVGLDAAAAKRELLEQIKRLLGGSARPSTEPAFPTVPGRERPTSSPNFPGTAVPDGRAWRQVAEQCLGLPLTAAGELPTVRDVDPYVIGVQSSAYRDDDPYVARPTSDAQLRTRLTSERFVLVVGPSTAGKSRTAFEAVREVYRDAALVVPAARPHAVRTLLEREEVVGAADRPVVLWLDDLNDHLAVDRLDRTILLGALRAERQVIVVATMRSDRYRLLMARDGAGDVETRRILEQAGEPVWVDATALPGEIATASRLYPRENFAGGVGIGEQLVAAPALRRRYRTASAAGRALVQAAVDWVRAGLSAPIPGRRLRELALGYLGAANPTRPPTANDLAAEIAWACQAVASHVSLLREVAGDGDGPAYEPHGYLITFLDGEGESDSALREPVPIPDHAWEKLLRWAPEDEVLALGLEALIRGVTGWAAAAGRRALETADPRTGWLGMFFLGQVAFENGDYAAARGWYERFLRETADSRDDIVAVAKLNLGVVLADFGDAERAGVLFEELLAAADAGLAARSRLNLGRLMMDRARYEPAVACFTELTAVDDPIVRAWSHYNLAAIDIIGHGDRRRAAVHLDQALEIELASVRAAVTALQGKMALDDGDLDVAQAWTLQALELADASPAIRAVAQANLGEIHYHRGEPAAREFLEAAVDSGLPVGALPARITLARMVHDTDPARARDLFTEVSESQYAPAAEVARLFRAVLCDEGPAQLAEFGRLSQSPVQTVAQYAQLFAGIGLAVDEPSTAWSWLERAASSPLRGVRSAALLALGDAVSGQDPVAAAGHWRQALDERDFAWSPEAALRLANQAERADDVPGATALYGRAMETGDAETAAQAGFLWGALLHARGDVAGARDTLRQAITRGDRRWSFLARLELAILEAEDDRVPTAQSLLREVIDGGAPDEVTSARHVLADLLVAAGSVREARALYSAVLEEASGEQALMARADLGYALLLSGDVQAAEHHLKEVIEAGSPTISPLATLNLAVLRLGTGRDEEAEALLRSALDADNPRAAALAAHNLAVMLAAADQPERARELFGTAAASGLLPAATMQRARVQLAISAGELGEAEELAAAGLRDPHIGALDRDALRLQLGVVLRLRGHDGAAVAVLGQITDAADFEVRAAACDHLGDLMRAGGDRVAAAAWYGRAIDAGHPVLSAEATIDLADLLLDPELLGYPELARDLATVTGVQVPQAAGGADIGRRLLLDLLLVDPPVQQRVRATELLGRAGGTRGPDEGPGDGTAGRAGDEKPGLSSRRPLRPQREHVEFHGAHIEVSDAAAIVARAADERLDVLRHGPLPVPLSRLSVQVSTEGPDHVFEAEWRVEPASEDASASEDAPASEDASVRPPNLALAAVVAMAAGPAAGALMLAAQLAVAARERQQRQRRQLGEPTGRGESADRPSGVGTAPAAMDADPLGSAVAVAGTGGPVELLAPDFAWELEPGENGQDSGRLRGRVRSDVVQARHVASFALATLRAAQQSAVGDVDRDNFYAGVSVTVGPAGEGETGDDGERRSEFDDIGGLPEVVRQLRDVAMEFAHLDDMRDWDTRAPLGIVLHGPPGTGKTTLAKALAAEIGAQYRYISATDFLDPYVGVAEQKITEMFGEFRAVSAPTVVVFDEFDSIITNLTGAADSAADQMHIGVAGIFRRELNSLGEDNPNILLVAITNHLDRIDPALIRSGRFDLHVEVPLPDAAARVDIFEKKLRRFIADRESTGRVRVADDVELTELGRASAGFSGADIEETIRRAKRAKGRQQARGTAATPIGQADLLAMIREVAATMPARARGGRL